MNVCLFPIGVLPKLFVIPSLSVVSWYLEGLLSSRWHGLLGSMVPEKGKGLGAQKPKASGTAINYMTLGQSPLSGPVWFPQL